MVMPAAEAVSLASVICAAVGGCEAWISQPETLLCRPSAWMACSVITVLGPDVPDGRAPTSWITGLARHWPGHEPPLSPYWSRMPERPDNPGRMVRRSASALISDALIPKACRSWGVATKIRPDQDRPAPRCSRLALVWSSSLTVFEPRALAMFWATAA